MHAYESDIIYQHHRKSKTRTVMEDGEPATERSESRSTPVNHPSKRVPENHHESLRTGTTTNLVSE